MTEYIDRVALNEVLERYLKAPHVQIRYNSLSQGMRVAINGCIDLAKSIYAADVVPVRHGEWIIGVGDDDFDIKCSKCGWVDTFGVAGIAAVKRISKTMYYCPNCGAKMDKESENDK